MILVRIIVAGRASLRFDPGLRLARSLRLTSALRFGPKTSARFASLPPPARPSVSPMSRLLALAKSEKWSLTGGVALLFISSTVTMAVPFALGRVIDLIYSTNQEEMASNLNSLAAGLLGVFILGAACNSGRVYLMSLSGQRITRLLREKLYNSIMRQEVGFFDKNKTGELVNRLSADTALVSQSVTMNISDGLRSFVMVLAGTSMMFYMSAELALVSLLIVPPVAGMAVVYGRFVRRITRQVQDSLGEATQIAEERISNIRTVKSFGKEAEEMGRYSHQMQVVLDLATREAAARSAFFGMAGLCGNLVALSVLYYGGVKVTASTLSVGDLSAFLLYAAYIGISLSGLSSFYSEMNRGLGASTRLFQIIDRVPLDPCPAVFPIEADVDKERMAEWEVSLKGVEFAYPERDGLVLRGVNLIMPSGTVTAVVGPSGSGKSTLAALLLSWYQPSGGEITLNSLPLHSYPRAFLTRHIASVPQEPVLFSGSVRENVLYGGGCNVSESHLESALKEANALEFVDRLPQGRDTLVGERGLALSGGQRQRIAIARALLRDPRILVLDEATSALDAESEHLVQEALERIMKGRTVLTIAHRLSTIRNSDQIAVLENGRVVELGSYEELLRLESGVFRNLIKHQALKT